mmetsp:Transcript_3155/g.6538  ORF Transcript_3155/g.6538 Transcript_3155/m.6538 type:complete len:226 (-) Transcript_3155:879-1556(-)
MHSDISKASCRFLRHGLAVWQLDHLMHMRLLSRLSLFSIFKRTHECSNSRITQSHVSTRQTPFLLSLPSTFATSFPLCLLLSLHVTTSTEVTPECGHRYREDGYSVPKREDNRESDGLEKDEEHRRRREPSRQRSQNDRHCPMEDRRAQGRETLEGPLKSRLAYRVVDRVTNMRDIVHRDACANDQDNLGEDAQTETPERHEPDHPDLHRRHTEKNEQSVGKPSQ